MAKIMSIATTLSKYPLIFLIKCYQWTVSPLLGHHCRFFPSCSHYALEAIETYGIVQGSYLGIKRILRCQPFCQGGIDAVPIPKTVEIVEKNCHD